MSRLISLIVCFQLCWSCFDGTSQVLNDNIKNNFENHLGFNAKGTLLTETQLDNTRAILLAEQERRTDVSKLWFRVQGGTTSQTTYSADWPDAILDKWIALQQDFNLKFIFVINVNDSPSNQRTFFNRWITRGGDYHAIEVGNELYLPKFKNSTPGTLPVDAPEVTAVTAGMTADIYMSSLAVGFVNAFSDLNLPFFFIAAPEKPSLPNVHLYNMQWNQTIASHLTSPLYQSVNSNLTLHLYEKTEGDVNYNQIPNLRNIAPAGTKIWITESGVVDDAVIELAPNPMLVQGNREVTHMNNVLTKLVIGDLILALAPN